MENLSNSFSESLYELSKRTIDSELKTQITGCIADYIAVTMAGTKLSNKTVSLIESNGSAESPVIGYSKKSSLLNAALVNGIHSHLAELDDGERRAMLHPGAPVLSALLSYAAARNISGSSLLRATLCGYEAAIRLAATLQPELKDSGYHASGVCGAIGAAVAIQVASGNDARQLKDSISAAATSASGILQAIRNNSELKPYHVGQAAMNGILAGQLVAAGFQGPDDILGGKHGFLKLYSNEPKLGELIPTSKSQPEILKIYRKLYAACRHCHAPIEAALTLRNSRQFDIATIEEIDIQTYFWAVGGHDHTVIDSSHSAKMSIPYSVAVALVANRAGLEEFSEKYYTSEEVLRLTEKVKVRADDRLTALVPGKRAAIVHIKTRDAVFTHRIDLPKGEPENPVTTEELEQKFTSLAMFAGKTEEQCQRLLRSISQIEENSSALYSLL